MESGATLLWTFYHVENWYIILHKDHPTGQPCTTHVACKIKWLGVTDLVD